jgi:AcrR family transcriptional regulator
MTSSKPAIRKGAYHHGELKEALKKAALHLVRQKGPEGFSLNEASRQAGVTVAAPYRHFEDKNALLAEIACDGCKLMVHELNEAVASVSGTKAKMLETGMAYLRFASVHADYFAVIFNAGLDKSKYPELKRAAGEAFGVILGLSQQAERTAELGVQRAISAWALVHGLATLAADGALSTAMPESSELEHLRPLLRNFLSHPYGASSSSPAAENPLARSKRLPSST